MAAAGAGAGLGSVTAGGLSSQLFGDGGYSWSDAGGDFAIGAGGGLVSAGAGSLAGRAGRTAAGRAVVSRVQVAAAWLARNAPGPRPKDLSSITCAGAGQVDTEAATLTTAVNPGGVLGGAAARDTLGSRLEAASTWKKGNLPAKSGPPEGLLVKRSPAGQITNYAEYDEAGNIIKRVDLSGRAHNGIPTPHSVDYVHDVNPSGEIFPRKLPVRAATADEVP
ncbi:polymorphic toxin type 24 domain-containing protein [Frankia sp. Cas8]|uniref:polymorphic toxin type 24 domain-containing protein n=1 Tax=unclassified Frankia TaxID=2632575 RepID=UPI003A10013D